jgi:hypothetical protein
MRGLTFDCFGHVESLPAVPETVLDGIVELSEEQRMHAELATVTCLLPFSVVSEPSSSMCGAIHSAP